MEFKLITEFTIQIKASLFETSLESNLSIISNVKTINTEQFKQKFLQTIHDLNYEQQMKFFKFWFGSSGLSTFHLEYKPSISISDICKLLWVFS
jgi:hypothetical protein